MLEYVHYVPGRLRLTISELRHRRRAAEAEACVLAIPAVTEAVANPLTGSLTIHFDQQRHAICDLWEGLRAQGYVASRCPGPIATGVINVADPAADRLAHAIVAVFVEAVVQHSARALLRALL